MPRMLFRFLVHNYFTLSHLIQELNYRSGRGTEFLDIYIQFFGFWRRLRHFKRFAQNSHACLEFIITFIFLQKCVLAALHFIKIKIGSQLCLFVYLCCWKTNEPGATMWNIIDWLLPISHLNCQWKKRDYDTPRKLDWDYMWITGKKSHPPASPTFCNA